MKKRIVYLFGAGASKDFGMPLGNEIFEKAYRLPPRMKPGQLRSDLISVLQESDEYLSHIFTSLPKRRSEYPAFEEVLTFLWDYRKSERHDYNRNKRISVFSNPGGAREVFDVFARMLGLTLVGSMLQSGSAAKASLLGNFVKSVVSNGDQVSFVSMNYDTLLDQALLDCVNSGVINDFTYGIAPYDIASRRDPYNPPKLSVRKSGVYLFKPHGSLNLVYCSHPQYPHGEGFFYSDRDLIATRCGELRCPACGRVPKPLIIPPLYNKAEYIAGNAVRTEHQINFRASPETYRQAVDFRLREKLAEAEEIVVIGYSMPAYDYDFRTLFVSSLMHNKRRKRIILRLITKGPRHHIESLKSQFSRFVGSIEVVSSNGFLNYLKDQAI